VFPAETNTKFSILLLSDFWSWFSSSAAFDKMKENYNRVGDHYVYDLFIVFPYITKYF